MKTSAVIFCFAALTPALLHAQQSGAGARKSGIGAGMLPSEIKAPASRVITDDELRALRSARNGGGEAPKPLPPKKHGMSLVDMSTILSNGGFSTLLPKGSVVWYPEALKPRIVSTPGDKVIPWQEFLASNRNWIATFEVTVKQVRGEEPLPYSLLEAAQKRKVMAVATLNGFPVTVLPFSPLNIPASK